jgi:hypothetical integral membrane protein (TIGR02206 family)
MASSGLYHPAAQCVFEMTSNIYMVVIFFVNSAIGSNYLMVNGKPNVQSLLDLLPDWPYYLIHVEAIGIITCLLLYLPFAVKDWRAQKPAPGVGKSPSA